MKHRLLFAIAALGVIAGLVTAYLMGGEHRAAPPLFAPAPNPYAAGIYANGIIESAQGSGENVNLFAEVTAPVRRVLVADGSAVHAGQPLIELDDRVQRATTTQLQAQADAAERALAQLRAQPRREQLEVSQAQLAQARASLQAAQAPWRKLAQAFAADPGSTSRDALDNAANQVEVARTAVEVAQRQLALTRAGAWAYDIRTQESQWRAALAAWRAAQALLDKYTLRAPIDGVVIALNATVGALASAQGVYSAYTQGQDPLVVMSSAQNELAVRVYVDEILLPKLPAGQALRAQMSVRGSDLKVPLVFDRIQPYVTPKIQLSDQRQEKVDLRVLPVVFRFRPPAGVHLYPGQLVDVYIEQPALSSARAASR